MAPLLKLNSLVQQLHSLEAPSKQAVQAESESVTKSLSQLMPGGVRMSFKLNFGVVKRGVGMTVLGSVHTYLCDYWLVDCC